MNKLGGEEGIASFVHADITRVDRSLPVYMIVVVLFSVSQYFLYFQIPDYSGLEVIGTLLIFANPYFQFAIFLTLALTKIKVEKFYSIYLHVIEARYNSEIALPDLLLKAVSVKRQWRMFLLITFTYFLFTTILLAVVVYLGRILY